MSHIWINKNWAIYRVDPVPGMSHIYHDGCSNRPEGSGEYFSIDHAHMRCDYCGKKVPKRIIAVWKKTLKSTASDPSS